MKKLTIVFAFLISSFVVKAQGIFENINRAEAFFSLLDSGKYEKAFGFFDASVGDKLKPADLENLWKQMETSIGQFQSVDGVQNKIKDDFQLVILNLKFERDTQPFQLAFNKQNKVVGIFLVPKSAESAYKVPVYVDTASYTQKLVTIKSGKYELPAMLTSPRDSVNFPIVVFIHGSGPADMDESIGPNKPFKDIALGLASKGIASVRYVKRTLTYAADFGGAFTVKEEVIDDAVAAIDFAKRVSTVDSQKVYVFGHSLGGMLAPRIATQAPSVKGLILAAAPARKFQDIMIEQNNYMFGFQNDTSKAGRIALTEVVKKLNHSKTFTFKTSSQDSIYLGLPIAYWADLNMMSQTAIAKKLDQRMLIVQGGHDFQVGTNDLVLWQSALKGKRNVDSKLYPMLNHLFAFVDKKGDTKQYSIPLNVDQTFVDDLASWIKQP